MKLHLADLSRPEAELPIGLHVGKSYSDAADVDPTVIARIAEQGDGNPFYSRSSSTTSARHK